MSKTQFPLQVMGFDALYGLEILSLEEEEATARVVAVSYTHLTLPTTPYV